MVAVELRDAAAGLLVRSYRQEDWQEFLHRCIAHAAREAAVLGDVDPVGMALRNAETERLKTVLRLLEAGTLTPADDDGDGDDDEDG
jgi:hypothetical protein